MIHLQILSMPKIITCPVITLISVVRGKAQWGEIIHYQVSHFKCISIDFYLIFFLTILIAFLQKYDSKCLMKFNLYINTHPSRVKERLSGFITTETRGVHLSKNEKCSEN